MSIIIIVVFECTQPVTQLYHRAGERTDIAIKEVKPCIDRMRREDDLRRERDIMMRVCTVNVTLLI